MNLDDYGWQEYIKRIAQVAPLDFDIGRIAIENKAGFEVITKFGICQGGLRGRVLSGVTEMGFPKVGDWVRVTKLPNELKVMVEEVLPRYGKISRKAPQADSRRLNETEQVLVANVDVVVIVQSLPDDFNLRRLERYLTVARQSNARPVVVINKIDLHDAHLEMVAEARVVAQEAPVVAVSAQNKTGLKELQELLAPGQTVVFIGSSGVGKSSIINALIGSESQSVHAIRESDGRGRHTTTKREMILLDNGSILIDTPGMRELALWADESEVRQSFEDVDDLVLQCRFSNCDHQKSDGCAVRAALDDGVLDAGRYQNYIKMRKEAEFLANKGTKNTRLAKKRVVKTRNKILRDVLQSKYGEK